MKTYPGSIIDHLKSIEKNFKENLSSEAYKKIKGVSILNPDKRDGSIFNAYLNKEGEIEFDSQTDNCLIKLSEIS